MNNPDYRAYGLAFDLAAKKYFIRPTTAGGKAYEVWWGDQEGSVFIEGFRTLAAAETFVKTAAPPR